MNEQQLNQFNQSLRANPSYQQFLRSIGVNTNVAAGQAWRLTDRQRELAKQWVTQQYGSLPNISRAEIDSSGNVNQDEGFSRYAKDWKTYAAIGAGLTGVGALGYGPMAGLFGSGAGAAGAGASAAGELAAGSIPTSLAMQAVPASIASQGVSAGLGAGLAGAGGAGAAGTVAAAGGGGAASAAGRQAADAASGGVPSFLRQLATPENGVALAALIAGLSSGSNSNQSSAEIQRIQAMNEARMRRADPLHQVAVNLAFGRLPTNYRQGVQLTNVPLPG